MTQYDDLYRKLVIDIIHDGYDDNPENVRPKFADGTPATTRMLLNQQLKFSPDEFPILTQKRVGLKDAIKELLWIWQLQSNKVQDLRDMGCTIWDEWELPNGTIGKAYGFQLGTKKRKVMKTDSLHKMIEEGKLSQKEYELFDSYYVELNQVDWLLYQLKTNPYSRRLKTTLWNFEELNDMALEPCVYDTHWQYVGNKLHLTVNIRSNDIALGNPYNVSQYAILHRMIAQVSNMEIGELCFNIDNAHIYHSHTFGLGEQIYKEKHPAPLVKLNPDIKSFYDFKVEDVTIENYKHSGSIKFEVAI